MARTVEPLSFAITPREERYRNDPEDFSDLPFDTRVVDGHPVPYIKLEADRQFAGITPMFSIKRHSRFQRFPEHCHDGIEFNYLYAGSCEQVVGGRRVTLRAGQALMLSPDTVHTILPLGEDDILINLNVNPDYLISGVLGRLSCDNLVTQLLVDSLESSLRHDSYLLFPSEGNDRLRTYIELLLNEWHEPSAMARDIVESLFILIVSELVIAQREHSLENGGENGGPMGTALPILHYLEECYANCTLEQTAEAFHLNPTYLSDLLKRKIGLSYKELVQHLRLDAAEHLLRTTSMSVTEIAHTVGYENVTFFYRVFERRNGCKPGAFRKRVAQG